MNIKNIDTRDAIFNTLFDIAKKDKNVILLTCDTGAILFKKFQEELPNQFFNFGISEQNAISVASGLSLSGKKVFVFGISNFVTLRCFEQLKTDVCAMNLPITILAMGAGYGYSSDGYTHHMIEDFSIARTLPNIIIWNISDNYLASYAVSEAYKNNKANYIRFDKGPYADLYDNKNPYINEENGFSLLKHDNYLMFITTGIMTTHIMSIAEELSKININIGVLDVYKFPYDNIKVKEIIKHIKIIVTVEENVLVGGLSESVSKIISNNKLNNLLYSFGLENVCRTNIGDREFMRSLDNLDKHSIIEFIKIIKGKNDEK